jgi:hypothetical protein
LGQVATPQSKAPSRPTTEVAAAPSETYSPNLVRVKAAAARYTDSINKNRNDIAAAVSGGQGLMFGGAKRPVAEMIGQITGANGHIMHLENHIQKLRDSNLPPEATGNIDAMSTLLGHAKERLEEARKLGTGPGRSRADTTASRIPLREGMRSIADVLHRVHTPILDHHPLAVVPENVDVEGIHNDLAHAESLVKEPSLQRNTTGRESKTFTVAGKVYTRASPEGQQMLEQLDKADGDNRYNQDTVRAIRTRIARTPTKTAEEKRVSGNIQSTSRDKVTDEVTENIPNQTTSPNFNDRRTGALLDVGGSDLASAGAPTQSERMKIVNGRKAVRPSVNKGRTFSSAVGKDLDVKEGAGNDVR